MTEPKPISRAFSWAARINRPPIRCPGKPAARQRGPAPAILPLQRNPKRFFTFVNKMCPQRVPPVSATKESSGTNASEFRSLSTKNCSRWSLCSSPSNACRISPNTASKSCGSSCLIMILTINDRLKLNPAAGPLPHASPGQRHSLP